ncbi:MAG: hypothetical protein PUE69_07400 [Ruminococcus sp.]|nr:hypothetical protein [Ruminococcus sp.]CDF01618.1 seryl-tRNA synthetase [Ruminococcus sp. CAG:624]
MKTIEYSTSEINASDVNVFTDMLAYVSEYIFKITRENGRVLLDIEDTKEDEVLDKIAQLRKTMELDEVKKGREVTTKVLVDKRSNVPLNTDNIFSKLVESGSVVKMTDGAYAYTGLFLQVYRYFCRKIDEFGKKHFNGIQEFEESVLYPVKEYETGHYFESFPHHIMFQTTMKSDAELLERFSKKGTNDSTIFSNDNMKRPENVVRHAACVPIYPMLKDAYIPADSPKYYLISGKCFRNEGANVYELARLNEFYMKEFVCIGTLEQTLDMIKSARALWEEWIDTFNLNCTIETANDSFFASNYKKLKIFQILGDSKQEFRVYIPDGDFFCAVSSSNVHRTHFTKTYNIHNDNSFCQSSCFAFGVERLSYALLSQKGVDIDKWDEATRKEIFG